MVKPLTVFVVLVVVVYAALGTAFVRASGHMPVSCNNITPLAQASILSMRSFPYDWSADRHILSHKNGVTFWVANGPASLRPRQPHSHPEWRGMTLWPSNSQICVYREYLRWSSATGYEPVIN
jgi:hypothetical protein